MLLYNVALISSELGIQPTHRGCYAHILIGFTPEEVKDIAGYLKVVRVIDQSHQSSHGYKYAVLHHLQKV